MDRHGLSPAEEAERTHVTEGLKREWGGRVGRLLAFCIDGGTLGARLALRVRDLPRPRSVGTCARAGMHAGCADALHPCQANAAPRVRLL